MEPICVRPHHGMCLAFYIGYGYSEGFNCHMGQMLERLLENPTVRLTAGCDQICAACPNNEGGVCATAEQVAGYDRKVLEACGLEEGTELPFLNFAKLVQSKIIATGKREQICSDCQWNSLCSGKSRWSEI